MWCIGWIVAKRAVAVRRASTAGERWVRVCFLIHYTITMADVDS
jgi:hypothetical protein